MFEDCKKMYDNNIYGIKCSKSKYCSFMIELWRIVNGIDSVLVGQSTLIKLHLVYNDHHGLIDKVSCTLSILSSVEFQAAALSWMPS